MKAIKRISICVSNSNWVLTGKRGLSDEEKNRRAFSKAIQQRRLEEGDTISLHYDPKVTHTQKKKGKKKNEKNVRVGLTIQTSTAANYIME